jgi:electron transfer flavoprotein alpha subunit
MSGVLVMAEERRGELRDISLELISAARTIKEAAGGPLTVAVVAADAAALAGGLSVDGVDEILTVTAPTQHFEAHAAQRALEALIDEVDPAVVLLGHTIDSLGYAPAVAARRGLGFASDVTAVAWEDGPIATRGAYGDKLLAELEFPGRDRTLLMVRAGAFEPATGAAGAEVRAVDVAFTADDVRTEHVEFREAAAGDVDITSADVLLSIGRGIEDKDNIPQFEELAERMGATLSVSRPLVDAGWMPSTRQVGQSGKTVKPKVYLAFGISGAVQHLAGMQKAETIIAVNTDPEAPIFNVAHFGAVADLFEVAEELEQQFAA